MTVPHRDFTDFHLISPHGYGASNFIAFDDWLNDHATEAIMGLKQISEWPGADIKERYDIFYKGTEAQGWGEISGADKVLSVCSQVTLLPPFFNEKPITVISLARRGCLYRNADDWDPATGTGRYTDGVSAQYFDYPHDFHMGDANMTTRYNSLAVPAAPTPFDIWHEAYNGAANNALSYLQSSYILTRGMILGIAGFTPGTINWDNGDGIFMNVQFDHVRIKYFNPVVNAFSRYYGPTAGGFPLLLYGLGLHNSEAEIDEGGVSRFVESGTNWYDCVDLIYIEDLAGNVVSTLQVDLPGVPGSRDFTYGSNTQITIYSFPALAAGVYQLRILKQMSIVGSDPCEAYAGDWRTDAGGRMRAGDRLYFYVGDEPPTPPIFWTKWKWKKGDMEIFRYYAPIDTRSRLIFWDGMIKGVSNWTRGTNDLTGLPLFPDLELELDNSTREFSKLLAEYWCKGQIVEAFFAWRATTIADAVMVFRGVVEDYEKPGSVWKVRLRDIMGKYFETKVPRYRVTEEDYPDIHPNFIGREMPECLGRGVLDTGSTKGAVEALCVDTVNYKYLASRGSLHAILNVYSNDTLVAPADYAISWADGGRTYITFDNDQGDNKITFDYEGYMYDPWNDPDSAGDYIRNPAYIMLFFLAFIAAIPEELVDVDSFDDLADYYVSMGWSQAGYYILQDEQDTGAAFGGLLYTYGAKCWEAGDGRVTIGRKRPEDFAPVIHLFQQLDAIDEATKPMGFDQTVNSAPIQWAFFPSANLYAYADTVIRQTSIDAFGVSIGPSSPWAFSWTDDAELAAARAEEDLLKLAFGDQKIQVPVSIEYYASFDILDTFRFQDPFGISLDGSGDVGRYWYIESLTFDVFGGKITVQGVDFQWLLRQYCVLGDEDARADNWSAATEADRMYCYLADEATGQFADGEPGKKLSDENL